MAPFEEIEHLWIEMPDGVRLAARAWIPRGRPAPACIEYIPYGKRWGTRERDESLHRPLASRGVACVRVDVRGSADSEGRLEDEYSEAELDDGCELIAWAAQQLWCNGRVFMLGKSWGGFNVLQIAARRPPQLSGVVSVYASDDRFGNDAHYMGGCLLSENQVWGSMLFALAAEPPSPLLLGERWRDRWLERLEQARPFVPIWLSHPVEDDYWRRGSVRHDYTAIQCPVFLVAGWNDPYKDGALRLARSLEADTTLLIGPWAHHYPHEPGVGPVVDFPALVADWIEGKRRGERHVWLGERNGTGAFHTIDETDLHRDATSEWRLGDPARFGSSPDANGCVVEVASPLTSGERAGAWCPFGPTGLPGEQSADDARSELADTPPLESDLTIFGFPRVRLRVKGCCSLLFARLLEVDPTGDSRRIAYGALRVRETGWHDVEMTLTATGHRFSKGSRIRVALATSNWPTFWPERSAPTSVDVRASSLLLPVFEDRRAVVDLPDLDVAMLSEDDAPVRQSVRRVDAMQRIVWQSGFDDAGEIELHLIDDIGVSVGFASRRSYRIVDGDPLSARSHVTTDARFKGPSFDLRVIASSRLRADDEEFRLLTRLEAFEGRRRIFFQRWTDSIGRAPE